MSNVYEGSEPHPSGKPKWNLWLPDEDRSAGWTNHCYVLQFVCEGFGDTPDEAALEATRAGRVPEGFEPDRVTAIRDDAENPGISLPQAPHYRTGADA